MTCFRFGCFCIALLGVFSSWPLAFGEDFRVENAVFFGDEKKPSSESTTIFQGGVVYDCLKSPAEAVIFDRANGRLVLLNSKRKVRTELAIAQLDSLVERLRSMAANSKDPVVRFLADPQFKESTDTTIGVLTLSSPLVTYRLVLAPQKSSDVATEYRAFCDAYAKLNCVLLPGSSPPFGRLALDAVLARHQATASNVTLTLATGEDSGKTITIRSEHRLVCPLESFDLERIAGVRGQLEGCKLVGFEEYQKAMRR